MEALGVRVRLVQGLGEGALYFRKRALALVDSDLRAEDRDYALDWISKKVSKRRAGTAIRQSHLTSLP